METEYANSELADNGIRTEKEREQAKNLAFRLQKLKCFQSIDIKHSKC